MARDRQRAKQRKARRAAQNPGPDPTEPHRSNVPGELDHASGDQDEFEAAIVAGAGGEPLDDEPGDDGVALDEPDVADDQEPAEGATAARSTHRLEPAEEDDEDDGDEELLDEEDTALEREAVAAGGRRSEAAAAPAPGAPTRGGASRLVAFLRASWAELQRVQWPDRRQVFQATAVVIGFVIVAGVYLGVADRIAQEIVDLII